MALVVCPVADFNVLAIAIGGINQGQGRLKTVEYYNPANDTWTLAPASLKANTYDNYGCVANKILYLIGGAVFNATDVPQSDILAFSADTLLNLTRPYVAVGNLSTAGADVACIPFY